MGRVKEVAAIMVEEYMELHPELSMEQAWAAVMADSEAEKKFRKRVDEFVKEQEKSDKKTPEGFCTMRMNCSHRYVCSKIEGAKKMEGLIRDVFNNSMDADVNGLSVKLNCRNKEVQTVADCIHKGYSDPKRNITG